MGEDYLPESPFQNRVFPEQVNGVLSFQSIVMINKISLFPMSLFIKGSSVEFI